jgi:hypothetical protein
VTPPTPGDADGAVGMVWHPPYTGTDSARIRKNLSGITLEDCSRVMFT